jgi:hypothetical protein
LLSQSDIVESVKEHLKNKGYTVFYVVGKNAVSVEMSATKDRDHFVIEAIWENERPSDKSIIFAIGKLIKRMKERGFWFHYAIAMPKSYFRFLGEFEAVGFELLSIHLFLVESVYTLTVLDPKETLELINELKAGHVSTLNMWGINYR